MIPWSPHRYKNKGEQHGVPVELIDAALAQALAVQQRGLPAILTLKHFSLLTGASYNYLREIVTRSRNPYKAFLIGKRKGGFRVIVSPERGLRVAQRWISDNILRRLSETCSHSASFAYAPGSSSVACAKQHVNCRWLIKIDLFRFFESISEIDVFRIFHSAGYQPLVSFELSRICTRVIPLPEPSPFSAFFLYRLQEELQLEKRTKKWNAAQRDWIISNYVNRRIGHLPQGAPTSPMLANLRMFGLDGNLSETASHHGLIYTRYSDDLCFSTADRAFDRNKAKIFIGQIYKILSISGFSANQAKTVISSPGSKKIVLGLLVDGDRLHLPREFKDRIRQHLFYLSKSKTVSEHAQRRHFRSVSGMLAHVRGLIDYARQIEPDFGKTMLAEYSKILSEKSCIPGDFD